MSQGNIQSVDPHREKTQGSAGGPRAAAGWRLSPEDLECKWLDHLVRRNSGGCSVCGQANPPGAFMLAGTSKPVETVRCATLVRVCSESDTNQNGHVSLIPLQIVDCPARNRRRFC